MEAESEDCDAPQDLDRFDARALAGFGSYMRQERAVPYMFAMAPNAILVGERNVHGLDGEMETVYFVEVPETGTRFYLQHRV